MWLVLLLGSCAPTATGPGGAVGRVVDPIGVPFEGLELYTTVDRDTTDGDGRFALRWGGGEEHLDFDWRGLHWRRDRLAEDDGGEIVLTLRRMRHLTLACGYADRCTAEVGWDLGGGLSATAVVFCDPEGEPADLTAIHELGPSSATCRPPGGEAVDSHLREDGDTLWISAPPEPVLVSVEASEGALPDDCEVYVGRARAERGAHGWWSVHTTGSVSATATCGGRPALPAQVQAGGRVSLQWSPTGPRLAHPRLPEAAELVVVLEGEEGWMGRFAPAADGSYALPPLAAGTYRLAFGDASLLVTTRGPHVEGPDTLYVLGRLGELHLASELDDGDLPVELQ